MKYNSIIILTVLVLLLMSSVASACSYHLGPNEHAVKLKKIHWYGSTTYSNQWSAAVTTWNSMGTITIKEDHLLSQKDLKILDVYSPPPNGTTTWPSAGYSNGSNNGTRYIQINTAIMSGYSSNERTKGLVHELGHALGINEISISGNIMNQGRSSQTTLGQKDKDVYRCIWG
ncbi:hypothetical protein [Methanolapillus ohkumae]|uniref:Peptidase M10 metallopeptidase domain-containing protein n=1 Tax=Methanolapillus ohkumae TaxID=3028298 RepID=A0AA96V597_9EURY|nr:hypothetical protein MsAm2_06870 [Methanosarcinaceae archaeon Am2]